MTGEAAAHPSRDRSVLAVDMTDEILGDETLPVAGGGRVRIHAAFMQRERARGDDDQLAETLHRSEAVGTFCKVSQTRHEDVVTHAVAVQQVYDGVAPCLILGIARRQVDGDVAVGGVSLEIALERLAVDDDALDGPGTRTGRAATAPRPPTTPLGV